MLITDLKSMRVHVKFYKRLHNMVSPSTLLQHAEIKFFVEKERTYALPWKKVP